MDKTKIMSGFALVAIGLVMLISPETCQRLVIVFIGCSLIVTGTYNLFHLRTLVNDKQFQYVVTVRGIFCLVIGLLAVFMPVVFYDAIKSIIGVMVYLLAISLFLSSVSEVFLVFKMGPGIEKRPYLAEIGITILIAVVLCILGKNVVDAVTKIAGLACVVCGAALLIYISRHKPLVIEPDSVEDVTGDVQDE